MPDCVNCVSFSLLNVIHSSTRGPVIVQTPAVAIHTDSIANYCGGWYHIRYYNNFAIRQVKEFKGHCRYMQLLP